MSHMEIEQGVRIAIEHHQAGRLAEAEGLYRQVLAQQPNHVDALHLLGVLAHQVGRNDVAVELIGKALSLGARHAEVYNNYAVALKETGKAAEAASACQTAIQLQPD